MPRRLVLTAVLAIAVCAVTAVMAVVSKEDSPVALRDQKAGIALLRPPAWVVQRYGRYCRRVGPGVIVTNVTEHRLRPERVANGCTNRLQLTGLRADHVIVDVARFAFPPIPIPRADARFPLELERFDRAGGSGRQLELPVVRGEGSWLVRVWIGPDATAAERRRLSELIASIRLGDGS